MAGFFSEMFGGGSTAEAADRNRGLAMDYYLRSSDALNRGYDTSRGALNTGYDAATAAYQPLATRYGAATGLYQDALGVNGSAGNARATAAFQTGPGYEFSRGQALDAVERRRATSGMWDSGNTDSDLLRTATGLADQEYGNWLTRLGGFLPYEMQATSGIANAATGRGTGLANLGTQYASDQIGLLGNLTSQNTAANNAEAAARTRGATNLFNAGMGVANLVAGGLGGGFGGALSGLGTGSFGGPIGGSSYSIGYGGLSMPVF